jgi:hypothetical protein
MHRPRTAAMPPPDTPKLQGLAKSKSQLLWFAVMFVVLTVLVLMAAPKEKEGLAKHYATLGLKPHASAAEVKKAYRCPLRLPVLQHAFPPPHAPPPDNWH